MTNFIKPGPNTAQNSCAPSWKSCRCCACFVEIPLPLKIVSRQKYILAGKKTAVAGFFTFFRLSFFSFSYLSVAVIGDSLGLLPVQTFLRKHQDGHFYHGVAKCSRRKFCSAFFTQISEHFHAYLRLHCADHSYLGIIGKIFSSCET